MTQVRLVDVFIRLGVLIHIVRVHRLVGLLHLKPLLPLLLRFPPAGIAVLISVPLVLRLLSVLALCST